ncbi:hypothetical protein MKEN_00052800 [Mycena kentingensis (nom. inval.)]|nr:hypothetical protein MKEN_00052800 [Mycena kentingensis (nom. inval.)]
MPRIRKKTSNRTKINDRRKIQNKVRESHKKKAKAAKKNPQWKSKHKKDPGIPSTFPYKEQILAEIAEQRREAAEEKQRRKDEKARLRKKQNGEEVSEDEAAGAEDGGSGDDGVLDDVKARGLNQGFEGISSLSAKQLDETKLKPRQRPAPMELDEPDADEVPVLVNPELPTLQSALEAADVVVEVLDARDPLAFRSEHIEALAAQKRVVFVLNKIDTCPRESVSSWLGHLRAIHPTVPFRSSSACLPERPSSASDKGKGKAKVSSTDALGADAVLELLGTYASEKKGDAPLCVAVVGVTNAGKSSFVNSLLGKRALPIYALATSSRGPTTTTYAQEVAVEVKGTSIRIIDTPGLTWETTARDTEADGDGDALDIRARDILLRSKGRIDRLKDPVFAVEHLVSRANAEDLMLFYNLPAFSAGDTDAFLSCVARANQLVKKRGLLDLTGAARIVLRDWSTGKLPWYTIPAAEMAPGTLSPADEVTLGTLQTRKELRKVRGLIKLKIGVVETRKALVEESWVPEIASESSDEEEEDEEGASEDGDEDGDEEEDDDDEEVEEMEADPSEDDEEATPPPILSGKQKRKRAAEKAAPRKKVSFGPEPKSSKQARSAAGAAAGKKQPSSQKAPSKMKAAAPPKKVANAPVKTKASQKAAEGAGDGQAYNFGQFF